MAGLTDRIPQMAQIRPAVAADAGGLAEVHVRTLQSAYRDIVPDSDLDSLSVADREESWTKIIAAGSTTFVADVDGAVQGFASGGPSRDDDAGPETGEVYALYVDPEEQGGGTGQMLIASGFEELAREGFAEATLGVLEKNARAWGFYEAAAMELDGGRQALTLGGVELWEVRHRWRLAPIPGARTSARSSLVVADYDEAWPALFGRERSAINGLLPQLAVEHIGSTSVPGLAAKPIIDIQAAPRPSSRPVRPSSPYAESGGNTWARPASPAASTFASSKTGAARITSISSSTAVEAGGRPSAFATTSALIPKQPRSTRRSSRTWSPALSRT